MKTKIKWWQVVVMLVCVMALSDVLRVGLYRDMGIPIRAYGQVVGDDSEGATACDLAFRVRLIVLDSEKYITPFVSQTAPGKPVVMSGDEPGLNRALQQAKK